MTAATVMKKKKHSEKLTSAAGSFGRKELAQILKQRKGIFINQIKKTVNYTGITQSLTGEFTQGVRRSRSEHFGHKNEKQTKCIYFFVKHNVKAKTGSF